MRSMSTNKITKASANTAFARLLVIVLLVLGSFLAVSIGSPSTAEAIIAATVAPIAVPTPDEEEINALVEQLKNLLAENVEDEDSVNSIVEKWEVRALARRTKKQIITTLFADVKSVVRDKETQDAVWASWGDLIAEAESEEPKRPSRTKPKPTPEEEAEEEEAEKPAPRASSSTVPSAAETKALISKLVGALADCLDDGDIVREIQDSWEKQGLDGMTRQRIVATLMRDVEAVVKDKATLDSIRDCFINALRAKTWDTWSIHISETMDRGQAAQSSTSSSSKTRPSSKPTSSSDSINAPLVGGQWVLTDELRRAKGDSETEAFAAFVYRKVKIWSSPSKRQYRGYSYSIYVATEPADPAAEEKIAGIENAVKTIVDRGYPLPQNLRFFCSSVDQTPTQAFKRGKNWMPTADISLGPGGSPDALSTIANGFNGFDTRTIRAIHEIGHVIHERQAGDSFWQPLRKANSDIAAKVSEYAANGNEKEFVAEVFAGLMIGKRWPSDVMAEYFKFRGPLL